MKINIQQQLWYEKNTSSHWILFGNDSGSYMGFCLVVSWVDKHAYWILFGMNLIHQQTYPTPVFRLVELGMAVHSIWALKIPLAYNPLAWELALLIKLPCLGDIWSLVCYR